MPRKPQHKDKALADLRAHALKLIHARNSYALSAFFICPPFNHPAKHLIDAPDPHGDTLVHFAARAHDVAALRILVTEFGGDAWAVNEHGRQPIHEAIDSAECVRFLVTECGVDINAMKRGDWTPLMIAAMKGNYEVMKILVTAGANVEMANKDGWNALHLAAKEDHYDATTYLALLSPVSTLRASTSGRLPIHTATLLLAPTSLPTIPLFLLANSPLPPSTLLAQRDNAGLSLLPLAVISGNISLICTLLRTYHADANTRDLTGRQPAHHAAMSGREEVLRVLWEETGGRVEVDREDEWDGWTPIFHAAKEGHLVVVRWLTEVARVEVRRKDRKGRQAVELAATWNHVDIVLYLSSLPEDDRAERMPAKDNTQETADGSARVPGTDDSWLTGAVS